MGGGKPTQHHGNQIAINDYAMVTPFYIRERKGGQIIIELKGAKWMVFLKKKEPAES